MFRKTLHYTSWRKPHVISCRRRQDWIDFYLQDLAVNAEETSISEKSFGCIRDSAVKVEGTFIRHADPARLKEAVQIFESDVADKEYPVGTTIQIIPGEAMVKESKKEFPNTNGWE